MAYRSLADMFISQAKRYGEKVLYRFPRNSDWESYSWNGALLRVREIALGLVFLDVRRGDRVAIFSSNRVEWNLVDWANICIGALTVPIYSSSTPSQVFHVLGHSEPVVLFVESWEGLKRIDPMHPSVSRIKSIVIMEAGKIPSTAEDQRVITIEALRDSGRWYEKDHEGIFERLADSLRPEDDLTIIYTSGTTGEPKGVLTTHGHYLFMISAVDSAIPSTDQDVTLHFLPSAHSFGRLEHFMAVAKGWTVGFARSVEAVAKDLRTIWPTIIFSVPRIYEIAYNRMRLRVNRSNAFRRLLESTWEDEVMRFENREHAGRLLARRLITYKGKTPLVLGIPRGAVPMAKIIADSLEGELDVVLANLCTETFAIKRKKPRKLLGRIPLPRKRGGPHGTRKGKKGYSRKRQRQHISRAVFGEA